MTSDPYTVRHAGSDDLLAVARLVELSPDLDDEQLSPTQRSTWDRMMSTRDLTVYLAEHGSVPVGYAASLQMPHLTYGCRPTVFIESMHVLEGHRRRGVARQMVDRLLIDALEARCHKVQLLTHRRHTTDGAHAFYAALGFDPEAEGFRLYLE